MGETEAETAWATPPAWDARVPDQPTFDFVFDVLPEDILAWNRHWAKTSASAKKRERAARSLCAATLLVIGAVLALVLRPWPSVGFACLAVFAVAAALFWMAWPSLYMRLVEWNSRRMLGSQGTQALLGTEHRVVDSEGVRSSSALTGSYALWPAIVSVQTSAEAVYLMLADSNGYLIPRRAFESPEHFDQFVERVDYWRGHAG